MLIEMRGGSDTRSGLSGNRTLFLKGKRKEAFAFFGWGGDGRGGGVRASIEESTTQTDRLLKSFSLSLLLLSADASSGLAVCNRRLEGQVGGRYAGVKVNRVQSTPHSGPSL